MLFGRAAEQARIAELLDEARDGRSGVLVLRGVAGVGKSALLDLARGEAAGMTVLYACGIESEARLPYAGLHQLVRPVLGYLDRLPRPQAGALRAALGLEHGTGDEWFLVSLAVLSLLAESADENPLLCVIDDAHWLDDASAESLMFAARRLQAEPIAMLFAAREGEARTFDAPGLDDLWLAGLDRDAASALLDRQVGSTLSEDARDRLISDTDGNPLALMELSAALGEPELAGLAPLPVSRSVERAFRTRVAELSDQTQTLLLVAAADDSGSASVVLRAAERLGVQPRALDAAEHDDLLRVRDGQLEFRHPLIRSAVYQAAPFSRRRAAHAALADVLDPDADADRRAWHRAAASVEVDATVAGELEQAASRAYRRSGFVAASLAFERAAELTPDRPHRVRLLSSAVDASWFAGRLARAQELLDRARPLSAGPAERAAIDRWRGLIEWSIGVPATARDLLAGAAADLPANDTPRGLHTLGIACVASAYGGEAERVAGIADAARRFRQDDTPVSAFLDSFVTGIGSYFSAAYDRAGEAFRAALGTADAADAAGSAQLPGLLLLAGASAMFLGDDRAAEALNHRLTARAREMGAVPLVNEMLPRLAQNQIATGRWASASADLSEGIQLATEIGQHQVFAHMLAVNAVLAALRGDEARCRSVAEQTRELAAARHLVHVDQTARWALVVLELGAGRPDEAYLHARQIPHLPLGHWAAPERIEAAARAGQIEDAQAWLTDFAAWADGSGAAWAQSAALRLRALLMDDSDEKQALLSRALELAEAGSRPLERARTQLAIGDLLRRRGQRVDARTHLREALERFENLGAVTLAERAREQLRASGQTARRRNADTSQQLTQQELQIARFVARGLSNREVAAQLFLSPRTIDFHLRKVFAKLGITSRTQLAHADLETGGPQLGQPLEPVVPAEG
ncbi:MAG TPA: AAA family ATPase [Jatrophihabitans sp.]|jgi:DNA-binding NarL/FixJ family response regulator|nr:AAA family ATPase [Jatrophihabitans sp.]